MSSRIHFVASVRWEKWARNNVASPIFMRTTPTHTKAFLIALIANRAAAKAAAMAPAVHVSERQTNIIMLFSAAAECLNQVRGL